MISLKPAGRLRDLPLRLDESVHLGAEGWIGQSALDFRPPKFVPLLNGKAWFMPAVMGWMALQDRFASRKAVG